MGLEFVLAITTIASLPVLAEPISQRVIYTYHVTPKTWNEAGKVCEDRFGQLVKMEPMQEDEVLYANMQYRAESTHNFTNTFWTGGHLMNNSGNPIYQDCLNSTTSDAINAPTSTQLCVFAEVELTGDFVFHYETCNTKLPFICQRTIGDCWFEPYQDYTVIGDNSNRIVNNVEETRCALMCRNTTDEINECWAFSYNSSAQSCIIHYLNETKYDKAPSVTYLLGDKEYLWAAPGIVVYLRRCFEGEMDFNTYDEYEDSNLVPVLNCAERDPEPAQQLCFCESDSDPPIPEPIPIEQKIEEIIRELTVEPSNTSAAIRKKTCAEDDRPSALGVGYVGAGVMTIVFGGLFLLDAQVLFAGIKKIFKVLSNQVPTL